MKEITGPVAALVLGLATLVVVLLAWMAVRGWVHPSLIATPLVSLLTYAAGEARGYLRGLVVTPPGYAEGAARGAEIATQVALRTLHPPPTPRDDPVRAPASLHELAAVADAREDPAR